MSRKSFFIINYDFKLYHFLKIIINYKKTFSAQNDSILPFSPQKRQVKASEKYPKRSPTPTFLSYYLTTTMLLNDNLIIIKLLNNT